MSAIDGLASINQSYIENIKNNSADKLDKTISKDYASATEEELMNVCKEFESYFTEQVFKSMKKMVPNSDEDSSESSTFDMFEDLLTQEYAKNSAESGGLGIAQMLFEQMKRNYDL